MGQSFATATYNTMAMVPRIYKIISLKSQPKQIVPHFKLLISGNLSQQWKTNSVPLSKKTMKVWYMYPKNISQL